VAHDNYTQVLLTSVANTKYANGPRGTFTQTPAFCGENTFLLPNNTQNASRAEYLRIKDKYCSTPGYRLSAHELNVLSSGEPEELRKYRIQMQIDNQQLSPNPSKCEGTMDKQRNEKCSSGNKTILPGPGESLL
jgi:hypothetical protein